jgi:molybdopterin synthase sulfur carrier subunit
MQVNFYATLRAIAGKKTVVLDLPYGVTVDEIIHTVVRDYPDMRRELFDEHGVLYGHIHIFVNGRDVIYLPAELGTRIQETDRIDIFPPVGGGRD